MLNGPRACVVKVSSDRQTPDVIRVWYLGLGLSDARFCRLSLFASNREQQGRAVYPDGALS